MAISSINCRGKLLSMEVPLVMGILNCTPDSFSDGDPSFTIEGMVEKAGDMLRSGAAILDLGGQSTRPGSVRIPPDTEAARVLPVIQAIHAHFPDAILSIDTYHHQVALDAIDAGASIVNDISGGELDNRMMDTVAELQVPYICMHMQGTPETMQVNPTYNHVVLDVLDNLIRKVERCRKKGIHDLIIDPGFGFGKSNEHNFELLKGLHALQILECPILLGISRKGMIHRTLNILPNQAANGTTALHMIGLLNGVKLLRTHDVREAVETITLFQAYKKAAPFGTA
jgi:dihydropteroate synthase